MNAILQNTGRYLRLSVVAASFLLPVCGFCAETPLFVTYTTQMEELGDLEITDKNITGKPDDLNRFGAAAVEFEYGAKPWWTTEFYLNGQVTQSESALFTGIRWENRFRVLHKNWLNAVLYFEYEDLSGADKTLLEVVGNDRVDDLGVSNSEARLERERELEMKLILDRDIKGWTIAGNFIAEKIFAPRPYEFGYAIGIIRPLARKNSRPCRMCLASMAAGLEVYGGLGTTQGFGFRDTSHYIGPALAWSPGHGTTFRISPNFGLNSASSGFLLRFGVTYEVEEFGRTVQNLFRRH